MEREYDYIRGNTAVNPNRKYKDFDHDQKKKDLEKAELEKRRKLNKLKQERTKEVIQIALIICVLGVGSIMREGRVYKAQQQLSGVKSEMSNVLAANEALRVDLLKVSSLENVKSTAEAMGMVNPKNKEAINVDMSKDYFPELKENKATKKQKNSLFTKREDALKN